MPLYYYYFTTQVKYSVEFRKPRQANLVNTSRIYLDESRIHNFLTDEVACLEKSGFTVADFMPHRKVDHELYRRHVRIYLSLRLFSHAVDTWQVLKQNSATFHKRLMGNTGQVPPVELFYTHLGQGSNFRRRKRKPKMVPPVSSVILCNYASATQDRWPKLELHMRPTYFSTTCFVCNDELQKKKGSFLLFINQTNKKPNSNMLDCKCGYCIDILFLHIPLFHSRSFAISGSSFPHRNNGTFLLGIGNAESSLLFVDHNSKANQCHVSKQGEQKGLPTIVKLFTYLSRAFCFLAVSTLWELGDRLAPRM